MSGSDDTVASSFFSVLVLTSVWSCDRPLYQRQSGSGLPPTRRGASRATHVAELVAVSGYLEHIALSGEDHCPTDVEATVGVSQDKIC